MTTDVSANYRQECTVCHQSDLDLIYHSLPGPRQYVKINREIYMIRTLWKKLLDLKIITNLTRVCSRHFTKNDYVVIDGRIRLKSGVIPSRNLPGVSSDFIMSICDRGQFKRAAQTQTEWVMTWKDCLSLPTLKQSLGQLIFGINFTSIEQIAHLISLSEKLTNSLYDVMNNIIMIIWKYQTNLNLPSNSHFFSIHAEKVNDIFYMWTKILYRYFVNCYEKNQMKIAEDAPPKLCFVDIFEVPVAAYNEFYDEMNYSDEWKRTTFKTLVVFDEQQILYVSDLFGGSTSSAHILLNCSFEKTFQHTKDVLIFSDSIDSEQSSRWQSQTDELRAWAEQNKTNICNKMKDKMRKKFRILFDELPFEYWPLANKIVHNCLILQNFSV